MPEKSIHQPAKTVLYIITKSVWGGAQKYVYDLASNLPRDRFNVIVAGGGQGAMAQKLKATDVNYLPIKSFQRNINFFKDFIAFFEILFMLFKTKPDIIHISSSKAGGVVGIAGFIYCFAGRAVLTVHGWAFLEQRPKWQNWLIKLFSKLTCLFYDKIICVSENDYKMGLKYKIAPARKMFVIHNGIDPDSISFVPREESQKKLLSKTSPLVVGVVAEWTKNKGLFYFLEAVKNKNCDVVLIGSGENPDKEKIYGFIKKFNLKNIYLHEFIPDAASYLKALDVFVLPSTKEGLPYTILEAGLAKLSVIATSVGGIPEIIQNEKTGLLVPPADSTALTNAIKKLADNQALREKLGINLQQKITQEFTLSKMLSATIAAYEN